MYAACSVENPTEELAWLRKEIQAREQDPNDYVDYQYIVQAAYEGETVFIYRDCYPYSNSIVQVFNCSGELLGYLGYREEDIDFAVLENVVTIWRPATSKCSL